MKWSEYNQSSQIKGFQMGLWPLGWPKRETPKQAADTWSGQLPAEKNRKLLWGIYYKQMTEGNRQKRMLTRQKCIEHTGEFENKL